MLEMQIPFKYLNTENIVNMANWDAFSTLTLLSIIVQQHSLTGSCGLLELPTIPREYTTFCPLDLGKIKI
jgi:hypothetical protein